MRNDAQLRAAARRTAGYARLAVASLLLAAILIFASQNADVVSVRFLAWRVEISLALLLFLAFSLGAAAGALVTGLRRWRRSP